MGVLKATITALALLVLVTTALAFIRTDEWWVRVCDFPRLQITSVGLILLVLIAFWPGYGGKARLWLCGLLCVAVAAQAWHLFPYTTLSRKQVLNADAAGPELKILISNVLQQNRDSERLLALAATIRPDVILLSETDAWWTQQLEVLNQSHPHLISRPQENGYGMNLFSRFPLHRPEVRFLTDPGVPSFHAGMEVNGKTIQFYAVHPRPPGIMETGPTPQDSGQRDAELVLVAREVREHREPVIVAGDFNDVAWSHTTRLFQRISRLLDPRVGRGLFNTFHVRTPFLRFPLDHLFHSDHFRLVDLQLMNSIGSDHFPVLVVLRLQEHAKEEQEAPSEKPSDEREADDIVEEKMTEKNSG
jgi:endonuclease/exonuclease/phosphatase (EEP) superfamily protein YafD